MTAPAFPDGARVHLKGCDVPMVVANDPTAPAGPVPLTQCCWLDASLQFRWCHIPTVALEPYPEETDR